MEKDSGIELTQLRADGGAARCDFLLQFQADLLGVPVVRPHITETTALGAAQLAGLPPGTWKAERRFEPSMAANQREALLAGWREALRRTRSES
jgi:glycerol kinase